MKSPLKKQVPESKPEVEAWQKVAEALHDLEPSARLRILKSVSAFFEMELDSYSSSAPYQTTSQGSTYTPPPSANPFSGSDDRMMSAKEFLNEKRPTTDIDRVACLAYYLANYKNMPQFKTVDISKLNTDAAQVKFSNAASSVDNATRQGLLVPANKGHKQLSAVGERYVAELPDKAAARAAIATFRRKKTTKRSVSSRVKSNGE